MFHPCRSRAMVFLALSVAGCSFEDSGTAMVAGKVSYKDLPVTGRITFVDERGHPTLADIGSDGSYKIRARLNLNRVAVGSREPDVPNPEPNKRPTMIEGKSLIPDRYERPQTSGLTYTVSAGVNRFDIVLAD